MTSNKKKTGNGKEKFDPGCKVIAFPGNKINVVLTPRILGRGQYGAVHFAYLKGDDQSCYAVKVMDRKRVTGKNQELLINEIEIMTEIQDQNVVSLKAATKTLSNYYLVMEFCNGGDLQDFIKARDGYLLESDARVILRQLVHGLAAIKA